MIYLDTHIVVWLYQGLFDEFSPHSKKLIELNSLLISPMVRLEMQYLYETGRCKIRADVIIEELAQTIDLEVCSLPFAKVINEAMKIDWTRDPFDRLITAQAISNRIELITKDQQIRKHCKLAVW